MKVYEQLEEALSGIRTEQKWHGSPRSTWRVGAGRVTTEEFEAWQLGPDLAARAHCERKPRRRCS